MPEGSVAIGYDFTDIFKLTSRVNFPNIVDPEIGVRLNIDNILYDDELLYCSVLISYRLLLSYVEKFPRVDWSMILTVDDIISSKGLIINLRDPNKRYPFANNIVVSRETTGSSDENFLSGYLEVPICIEAIKTKILPSIYFSVYLNNYRSNRIGIDIENLCPLYYVDGEISSLELIENED